MDRRFAKGDTVRWNRRTIYGEDHTIYGTVVSYSIVGNVAVRTPGTTQFVREDKLTLVDRAR